MNWPPPETDPPEITFHRVATTRDIAPGAPLVVRVGVKRVALFVVDGKIRAINNVCPHGGGSLGLGTVTGRQVTCPRHEWSFDLLTGECAEHPVYRASTYPVEVRGDAVFVGIPDEIW